MKPQIVRLVQGLKVTVPANCICMLDNVDKNHKLTTKERCKSDWGGLGDGLFFFFTLAISNNLQDANTLAS